MHRRGHRPRAHSREPIGEARGSLGEDLLRLDEAPQGHLRLHLDQVVEELVREAHDAELDFARLAACERAQQIGGEVERLERAVDEDVLHLEPAHLVGAVVAPVEVARPPADRRAHRIGWPRLGPRGRTPQRRGIPLDALEKPRGELFVDPIALGLILVVEVQVGVVVHLDDDRASIELLDVDAMEAVADQARGPAGDAAHRSRRAIQRHAFDAPVPRRAARRRASDLPVTGHHPVAACEQGPAVEHADAPIERRRRPRLRDEQRRVAEQLGHAALPGLERRHLEHRGRERSVRHLEDEGAADRTDHVLVGSRAHHDGGARRGHAGASEQLGEVHLVPAAQDRAGVVDHRDAERLRALCEAERRQVGPGEAAQEQRVVLGDAVEIVEPDAGDAQALAARDALEPVESRGVGGLEGVGGVEEHRERSPRLGDAALGRLGEELARTEGLREELALLGIELVEGHGLEVEEAEGAVDLREAHAADGNREALVDAAREARELAARRASEEAQVLDDLGAAQGREARERPAAVRSAAVEGGHADTLEQAERLGHAGERLERVDARYHLVRARIGEQRNVVALREVAVALAEVHDREAGLLGAVRAREIGRGLHHGLDRQSVRAIGNDDHALLRAPSGHGCARGATTSRTPSYVTSPSRIALRRRVAPTS